MLTGMNVNEAAQKVAHDQHHVELNPEIALLTLPDDNWQHEKFGGLGQAQRLHQQQ